MELTEDQAKTWDVAIVLVEGSLPLNHSKPRQTVLMFHDVSDLFGENFTSQVPFEEFARGVLVETIHHPPLGFVSGAFNNSQLRLATMDKETFALVTAFQRLN